MRFLLAALLLAAAAPVSATVIAPADVDAIVAGSQTIVRGRVVEVRSAMTNGRRTIHSFVTLAVEDTLKGSPASRVTFRVPVGQVGRYRRVIVGAPGFAVGEQVLVFLTGTPPAVPTIFGLNQGLYRVRDAARTEALTQRVRTLVNRAR